MDGLEAQEWGRRLPPPWRMFRSSGPRVGVCGEGRYLPPGHECLQPDFGIGQGRSDVLACLGPGIVRFAALRDGRAATAVPAVKTLEGRALIGARIVVIPVAGPVATQLPTSWHGGALIWTRIVSV